MNQDSIISSMNCACDNSSSWFSTSISFGEVITYFLTFLGFAIAIWQFSKQMKESRQQSAAQQSQTWFLNVIVVPQLDNIKNFYEDLVIKVNELRADLNSKYSHNTSAKKLQLLIAQKQQECKETINSFYDHFTALVSSYDNEVGNYIIQIGNDLEDICTYLIENHNKDSNVRERIFENEQNLFIQLNKGMKS